MKPSRRVAANLTIRAERIREARSLGLNFSEILEAAVAEAIRQKRREEWLEENREAISSYNSTVECDGVFGDRWRKF